MLHLLAVNATRGSRHLVVPAAFMLAVFLLSACATAPTIQDVDEIDEDTRIVFGSIEVYVDDKRQSWGMTWTGMSNFYVFIFPEGANEAITYDVRTDGKFYWSLPPGEYILLGYMWQKGTERRSGDVRARFAVPSVNKDRYLGAIEFRGNKYFLEPYFYDKYDQAKSLYDQKFPTRQGTSVKQLLTEPEPIGNFARVIDQCDASWQIECSDRFQGITPLEPEVTTSGFPLIKSLTPDFRWEGSDRGDVTYDLIIYGAVPYSLGGIENLYTKGNVAFYVEGLKQPMWRLETPLEQDTKYYWSVRLRAGDTVSRWSTQSYFTFLIVAMSSGAGQWFQFETH